MEAVQNFINGKAVDARAGATTPLVDPSTGESYGAAALAGPADVDDACAAAGAAFDGWGGATPSERALALLRIADALERDAERFIDAECRATGKPKALMASDEIPPAVDQLRFFAGAARMLEGRGAGEYMAGHTSYIRSEPIVCTPEDAYRCFMRTEMDSLVMGNFLFVKTQQPPWLETHDWRETVGVD